MASTPQDIFGELKDAILVSVGATELNLPCTAPSFSVRISPSELNPRHLPVYGLLTVVPFIQTLLLYQNQLEAFPMPLDAKLEKAKSPMMVYSLRAGSVNLLAKESSAPSINRPSPCDICSTIIFLSINP